MSHLRREIYRKKLNKVLQKADDEAFFNMAWATHAIQSDRLESGRRYLNFPMEAATSDLTSKYAIHPWKIETLLNEALATWKAGDRSGQPNRKLNCKNFEAIAHVIKLLANLENAEDGMTLKRVSVLRELHRLSQRQFAWQRGLLSVAQLYRSTFIYGGDLTQEFFLNSMNFSISDFSLVCFILRAWFLERPVFRLEGGFDELGLSHDTVRRILDLISIPHERAKKLALDLRSSPGHTGYKRSLLRLYPCVAFGCDGKRVRASLPDLITLRGTSGLFYDVVTGGDLVKNEIGRRFEDYCFNYLTSTLHTLIVKRNFSYTIRKGQRMESPDILVYRDGQVSLIIECKATRMSYEARYAENPMANAHRGYEEIAKGVFQIWRFVSHHRRGFLSDQQVYNGRIGMVLTLDTWLSMSDFLQSEIIELAMKMSASRDPGITDDDRIPIVFCPIEELEETLRLATDISFLGAVESAAEERFSGWHLSKVHEQIAPSVDQNNAYPFEDKVGDLLPWWRKFNR